MIVFVFILRLSSATFANWIEAAARVAAAALGADRAINTRA